MYEKETDRCQSIDVAVVVKQQFGCADVTVMSGNVQRSQVILQQLTTSKRRLAGQYQPQP